MAIVIVIITDNDKELPRNECRKLMHFNRQTVQHQPRVMVWKLEFEWRLVGGSNNITICISTKDAHCFKHFPEMVWSNDQTVA